MRDRIRASALCTVLLAATAWMPGGCDSREASNLDARGDTGQLRFSDAGPVYFGDGASDAVDGAADSTSAQDGPVQDTALPDARLVDEFGLPLNIIGELPLEITTETSSMELFGFEQTEYDAGLKKQVYACAGYCKVLSHVRVPVDPQKRYEVTGQFRSVGPESSRIYVGLAPFDEQMNFISVQETDRIGQAVTIGIFDTTKITTAETVTNWTVGGMAYERSLGFYFDGLTDQLPDWVWLRYEVPDSTDLGEGAFSAASDHEILLNEPIPAHKAARIVLDTTKVMNHSSGGTYLYVAASGALVPDTWTTYAGEITGEGFNAGNTMFRPTTAYVRFVLLLNYQQDASHRTRFTNLKLEEIPAS